MTKVYGGLWEVEFTDLRGGESAVTTVLLLSGPGISAPESIGTVFRYDAINVLGLTRRVYPAHTTARKSADQFHSVEAAVQWLLERWLIAKGVRSPGGAATPAA